MPIPPGTKFHGVAPGVETENKGSAVRNVDRDAYTIEEFGGGGSFRAIPTFNIGDFSQLVFISGVDAATGLPTVNKSLITTTSSEGFKIAGLLSPDAVRNEPSDVIVSGEVENVTFITPTGGGAEAGDILYAGTGYLLAWGGGKFFDESYAVGRFITTPTLVQSFEPNYDLYSATVLVTLPDNTAYYHDKVSFNDSIRPNYTGFPDTVVAEYNIVKSGASGILISRWDPAGGDTVDQIIGVTAKGYAPGGSVDAISVCVGGVMRIPSSTFVGGSPSSGDLVYSDSTTPYLLTTNSTSGFRIGFVVKTFFDTDDGVNISIVKVEVARSGGGGGATNLNGLTDVTLTGTPGNGEMLVSQTNGTFVNTTLTAGPSGFVRITNASGQVTIGAGDGEEVEYLVRSTQVTNPGEVEGNIVKFGTTTGMTAGAVYVWNGTDWVAVDADSDTTTKGLMGVALGASSSDDGLLTHGVAYLSHNPGAAGDILYVDTVTPGQLTDTQPNAQGDFVRVAGYCLAANKVFFSPSQDFIEIA